ncbi:hypothetical protein KC333_g206 [Hortaea werneckii]|nr:hypothetical protein KC333_g206 [Hortaea werneckii]
MKSQLGNQKEDVFLDQWAPCRVLLRLFQCNRVAFLSSGCSCGPTRFADIGGKLGFRFTQVYVPGGLIERHVGLGDGRRQGSVRQGRQEIRLRRLRPFRAIINAFHVIATKVFRTCTCSPSSSDCPQATTFPARPGGPPLPPRALRHDRERWQGRLGRSSRHVVDEVPYFRLSRSSGHLLHQWSYATSLRPLNRTPCSQGSCMGSSLSESTCLLASESVGPSAVSLLSNAELDTLALGQGDPGLLLADDEDVGLAGGELVVNGVLDVDDVETTVVTLTEDVRTSNTEVSPGIRTGRQVNLDGVVDPDGRVRTLHRK